MLFGLFCLALAVVSAAQGARRAASRETLLDAVNAAREAYHLRPLRLDWNLERAARAHTRSMLRGNYFSHGDFAGRMLAFHLRGFLGENLAWGAGGYGDPAAIVRMWLASPPHRANLLRPGFRRLGIGVAEGSFEGIPGVTLVTADFGS